VDKERCGEPWFSAKKIDFNNGIKTNAITRIT